MAVLPGRSRRNRRPRMNAVTPKSSPARACRRRGRQVSRYTAHRGWRPLPSSGTAASQSASDCSRRNSSSGVVRKGRSQASARTRCGVSISNAVSRPPRGPRSGKRSPATSRPGPAEAAVRSCGDGAVPATTRTGRPRGRAAVRTRSSRVVAPSRSRAFFAASHSAAAPSGEDGHDRGSLTHLDPASRISG